MSDAQLQNTLNFPENTEVGVRIRYIAKLNPKGVNQLAYQFGYPALKDHVDARVSFLNKFLKEEGADDFDKAFIELIKIHPDRKLISDSQGEEYGNYDGDGQDNIVGIAALASKLGKKLLGGGGNKTQQDNTYIQQQMLAEQQKAATASKNTLIAVSVAGGILIIIAVVILVIYLKKNK